MLCPHCGEKIERKKHTEYEGARDENWFTPKWVFECINDVTPIGFDPFSHPNALWHPESYCTLGKFHSNGTEVDVPEEWPYDARNWPTMAGDRVVYMNPPYGRKLPLCMKAANVADPPVWALVPSRLGTKWWDEYVQPFHRIQFLQRISFYDSFGRVRKNTPFSSTLVAMELNLDVVWAVAQRMREMGDVHLRVEVGS